MKDSKIVINGWWIAPFVWCSVIGLFDTLAVLGLVTYFMIHGIPK